MALVGALLFSACDYGTLGGADKTETTLPGDSEFTNPDFEAVLSPMTGVWYSHYAGIGRLDGYRIGKWEDFDALMEASGKTALFPDLKKETYTTQSGNPIPRNQDYFVFYDDTVYGETEDGSGGNGGWSLITRYIGIVRAVNLFYGDPGRGAIIIEYLQGCAPQWDVAIKDGSHPFFGIYYKTVNPDCIQMANAVDLAALYKGEPYYTETAGLQEAIEKNGVENEAEYISWGVVIPQDRE
jgi:hypothetical protein